jgi:hypothetical protein
MGESCSTYGEMRNANIILVSKTEGEGSLGREGR